MFNGQITLSTKTARSISDNHGSVVHARLNGSWKALCGTEPGRRSDWSAYSETYEYGEALGKHAHEVTCERCKKALYKLSERPQWGCDILKPW